MFPETSLRHKSQTLFIVTGDYVDDITKIKYLTYTPREDNGQSNETLIWIRATTQISPLTRTNLQLIQQKNSPATKFRLTQRVRSKQTCRSTEQIFDRCGREIPINLFNQPNNWSVPTYKDLIKSTILFSLPGYQTVSES